MIILRISLSLSWRITSVQSCELINYVIKCYFLNIKILKLITLLKTIKPSIEMLLFFNYEFLSMLLTWKYNINQYSIEITIS